MKESIETSRHHDIARFRPSPGKEAEELHEKYPPMVPVVRTHPETNELIYVNAAFTDHIVDMEAEEALNYLTGFIKLHGT